MTFWLKFWLKFWHGIEDSDDGELRAILARVEKLEPVWRSHYWWSLPDRSNAEDFESGKLEKDPFLEAQGQQLVLEDMLEGNEKWGILMKFVQNTPDGELTTRVISSSEAASVNVTLEHVGCLKSLCYFADEYTDPRGAKRLGAKVNKFTVQYVREWVRRWVLPALKAAEEQRNLDRERRNSDLQEREAKLESIRKKYLS